jgi:hypothetical protein
MLLVLLFLQNIYLGFNSYILNRSQNLTFSVPPDHLFYFTFVKNPSVEINITVYNAELTSKSFHFPSSISSLFLRSPNISFQLNSGDSISIQLWAINTSFCPNSIYFLKPFYQNKSSIEDRK